MIPSTRLLVCALVLFTIAARADEKKQPETDKTLVVPPPEHLAPFEIKDGDRVLLMGDTLIEREGDYGYLETRMHEQFPAAHFIVRNLGFSADTPLGASRASFDPVAKGVDKIKEQLALVKPTVAILGYGMAASLEEMTYRSGDPALNADVARYGTDHGVEKFKRDLGALMDLIEGRAGVPPAASGVPPDASEKGGASNSKSASAGVRSVPQDAEHGRQDAHPTHVRFVLLSPIRHEDLRAIRPGLPDPAAHNKLLEQYSKAIEELAKERGARFVSMSFGPIFETVFDPTMKLDDLAGKKILTQDEAVKRGMLKQKFITENGIHLSPFGYEMFATTLVSDLVKPQITGNTRRLEPWSENAEALRAAVLKKNALFFNRWRPANETYLLGFRKHEQGQNAKEIPMFDPLIDAADKEIDRIKAGTAAGKEPSAAGQVPLPAGEVPSAASQVPLTAGKAPLTAGEAPLTAGEVPLPAGEVPLTAGEVPLAAGKAPLTAGKVPLTAGKVPFPAKNEADGQNATLPLPLPTFTLDTNLEISVFAENPLLEKPTQMNWDARGRLWVASSSMYPMIAPGEVADDKVLVLEDTRHTGVADKSTVFADGLLLPTGVVPDLGFKKEDLGSGKSGAARDGKAGEKLPKSDFLNPKSSDACYVAASTQLLHFSNPDANGKATSRRIVLSGFGTEDTHHILHTLHWGPDGRLYFHQSIYIHSHIETPWGVVRANAGTVFAYDPRTERLEVFCKGLWNSWGQQEDRWGQTFLTDGAGSTGVSWAFPGEVWNPSEGSRKQAPQISPGGYPKFAGLELIDSPAFPDDWQGNAITCDFRAHRIVRFGINDLATGGDKETGRLGDEGKDANGKVSSSPSPQVSKSAPKLAGYATREMPDVLRTSDVAFRPIDVRHGPDGALYVADWSNPVINHGEVDFRDPRRDHHHGRIWRITYKGRPVVKWEGEYKNPTLSRPIPAPRKEHDAVKLAAFANDNDPRVRLEALRALARIPTARSAELVLDAAVPLEASAQSAPGSAGVPPAVAGIPAGNSTATTNQKTAGSNKVSGKMPETARETHALPSSNASSTPANDPWLDFAAWQSINDLAKPWSDAVLSGAWKADGREAQLEYALNAIDPVYAGPVIAALLKDRPIPRDGAGPWIELIGKGGSPAELQKLFIAATTPDALEPAARLRSLAALIEAARVRNARPGHHSSEQRLKEHLTVNSKPVSDGELDAEALGKLFDDKNRDIRAATARLAGLLHLTDLVPRLVTLASLEKEPGMRAAGFEGLREMGGQATVDALNGLLADDKPLVVRRGALVALAHYKLDDALAKAQGVFSKIQSQDEALQTWHGLLKEAGAIDALQKNFPKDLPPPVLAAALQAARELGHQGVLLANAIQAAGGKVATIPKNMAAEIAGMVKSVASGADPAEGEMLYRRIGCVQCHSIGGAGGKLGPDLTSIGASAPMDYLVESVLDPAAKVKEGYHAFAFTMKDGSQMTGIPVRETNTEQFIRPGPGPEVPIVKANIVKRENVGSLMPPGLIDSLQFVDKRSLFAFLGQLGRPGPFDASKGNVARVWWLYGAADFSKATKAEKLDEAVPTYSLVDGKLVRELLKVNADLVAKNGGDLYAVARFEAPGATKSPLTLTGAKEAWLDGKPFAASAEIAAGAHILAVKLDAKNLPEFLKAQCDGARFIGE